MPYLVSIAAPSTGHPDPIRGYVIHDYAGRDTNKVLIAHCSVMLFVGLLLGLFKMLDRFNFFLNS